MRGWYLDFYVAAYDSLQLWGLSGSRLRKAAGHAAATGVGSDLLGALIVESRKLEHHYPHALKVKYKESQH